MLAFLKANIWTIVVSIILIVIVALIIKTLVKDKKAGKTTCGGDCSKCHGGCSHKC